MPDHRSSAAGDSRPPLDPDAWVRTHRQTYDRMAADYARRIDDYAAADEAERFVRLIRLHRRHEPLIADIGCGPGRDALLLRLAGARTLGIDLSAGMLRVAAALDPSSLIQADLRRLPLQSAKLDALWCFAALGHLPPQTVAPVLREFHRVLGAGWLYLVVREGQGPRRAAWDGALPRYFTDFSMPQLVQHLRRAGFTIHERHIWPSADERRWLHVIARTA